MGVIGSTPMTNFAHLGAGKLRTAQTATWSPMMWDHTSGFKPPKLIFERPRDESARYLKAQGCRKNKFPQRKKDEAATPEYVKRLTGAMLNLAIMGLLVGWENVVDENGVEIPFPTISHDEPKAAGNRMVRDLLRALGSDSEAELVVWIQNDYNWAVIPKMPDAEEEDDYGDEEEDKAGAEDPAVPLDAKSQSD